MGKISFLFNNYVHPLIILFLYFNSKKKINGLRLGREIDVTYSHIAHSTKKLEELGLITKIKIGREKVLKLTDKGKEIAIQLFKMKEIYDKK